MMSNLIKIGLIAIIFASGVFLVNQIFFQTPCDFPVHYKIGGIDPRFNLTEKQLKTDTEEAAKVWSDVWQKPLFVYDPKGSLTISLIYDERAKLDNQINQLENSLQTQKSNLKPEVDQYKQESAAFDAKVEALNAQINYWNSKGGAPQEIYDSLVVAQRDLKAEAARLNAEAAKLNQSTSDYNFKVSELHQTVGDLNLALQEKPEEGIYSGADDSIVIYFDNSDNELIHTLAHEMGHALGLGHVSDKQAIMYAYTTQVVTATNADAEALKLLCQKPNLLFFQRFELIFYHLAKLLQSNGSQVMGR